MLCLTAKVATGVLKLPGDPLIVKSSYQPLWTTGYQPKQLHSRNPNHSSCNLVLVSKPIHRQKNWWMNAGESKAISEQPPEKCSEYQGEGARYPSASAVREESEPQGSPQDTFQPRAGVSVGLISDQSHTFVPLTNTQVKSDVVSFN